MKRFIYIWILLLTVLSATQAGDLKKVIDLRGKWKFTIGDNPRWARPDYDDSTWEKIQVPAAWEDEGFSGFDGYAWYRISLDLSNISTHNLYLVLGFIDDVDEVYLNGELIGFSGSFPPDFYTAYHSHRQYYIPPSLINRNGQNVIAVRVYDTILEGGIIKGETGIYARANVPPQAVLLEGIWRFREGDNFHWKESRYNDKNWQESMVPSYWRSLKKVMIEGTAWYRKTFTLPDYLKGEEDLALVLGYIDDFDETYLNGTLIGTTDDGRPFGWSQSYSKKRLYIIPNGILNKNGENVLAVRVSDIGGNAGIYKGPLAIVPYRQRHKLTD
ncbi:beta galactosidase jelly roll domain-containing protein [Marinoscillum furvescens]|uniref:Sialate O-acetylesterase n=1 Tax=Marinoscillum furvescens DSM 4134 TaxID=1122208 RepID=A0A3D9LIC6_MARFU|nr:beta galactosidase jelly roll domain-containing protein [Marinoscillum furvescens]REE05779.1 sialate O-acetylesterase [Marinoscillum furvescens DSM 4134]